MAANNASATPSATHEIRLAGPEDMPSVAQLLPELDGPSYSERFPGKTCVEFTRWKYFSNPAGDAAVGVALDGDRVVSIVAGTPKRVRLGADTVLAFELGDFITATDHRKRGLFSALINLVCDAAQQRGAAFVYVRPNDVSFPILRSRLSFVEPRKQEARRWVLLSGMMQRKFGIPSGLVRGLGVDWMARTLTFPQASSSVSINSINRFGGEVDRLWTSVRELYSFAVVRDCQYLNWRFVDCPTPYLVWAARRQGEMAGYLIAFTARKQPIATIVDFFTRPDDEDAAAALLRTALDTLLRSGVQAVYCWTLQTGADSAASRLLKRACMFVQKPLLHFAMRPLQGQPWPQELPTSGWQLTTADFDGV